MCVVFQQLLEERERDRDRESGSTSGSVSSGEPEEADPSDKDPAKDKKKKNRCAICRKKVGLTGLYLVPLILNILFPLYYTGRNPWHWQGASRRSCPLLCQRSPPIVGPASPRTAPGVSSMSEAVHWHSVFYVELDLLAPHTKSILVSDRKQTIWIRSLLWCGRL